MEFSLRDDFDNENDLVLYILNAFLALFCGKIYTKANLFSQLWEKSFLHSSSRHFQTNKDNIRTNYFSQSIGVTW